MNTKTHTDIKSDHWISHLPEGMRAYAYLARLDRPIGIWLLLLPGWWAIAMASGGAVRMNAVDWQIFALFGIGAIVMRAAGCVINDLWDRDLDKQVERTVGRPLASGVLSARQGFVFLAGLLSVGLLILLQLNFVTILLGILSLPFIVAYPLMKRITWWPQAFLGLTFNFGALMGWSAVTGAVGLPALLLYVSGIFWTLGYDTIYAHQDMEDDALAGMKSTALKFGDQSKRYVAIFYMMHLAALGSALVFAGAGVMSALLIVPLAHLIWQIRTWDLDDPVSSLKIFKSNRDYGVLVLLLMAVLAL